MNVLTIIKAILLSSVLFLSSVLNAAIVVDEKGIRWVSKRNLSSTQFSQDFAKYSREGYLMIDLDIHSSESEMRYSQVWRENTEKRGWYENRDMDSTTYHQKWQEYSDKGYRPLDVERYMNGSRELWAGIWVENIEGVDWQSHRGLTSEEHSNIFNTLSKRGYYIIDIEAYETSKGLRYSSIWNDNTKNVNWSQLRDMTREQYQDAVNSYSDKGMRVVDYESYETSQGQRYAAIWMEKPGFAWQVRSDRDVQEFINLWYQYADEGYRLVDFERYDTDKGVRYAGIWAENSHQFNYSKKSDIDNAVTNYLNVNNLPGLSVEVSVNGDTIYRRGFGFADVNNNKTANSKTVYNMASVAKVIGGTLAGKLEDEGELRDGTLFNLDLGDTTSSFINGLPAQHVHTGRQLMSHLSCIGHYATNPAIANQINHYTNATAAMMSVWNTGLVVGCTPGLTWSYSTPAAAFLGAILEFAAGKTVNELLDEELFAPYGLSSMRVQYADIALPENSLRAVPYTSQDPIHTPNTSDFIDPPHSVSNPNVATTYSDNSWKVLSGGLESNTYDLARFAHKVLSAEIVSADARDNLIWNRVNPGFTHAYGWSMTTASGGESVAQWNGSWTGSRTFLRAYTDDNLVIAIMSNRTNHRSDLSQDIGNLTNAIGNIVLN